MDDTSVEPERNVEVIRYLGENIQVTRMVASQQSLNSKTPLSKPWVWGLWKNGKEGGVIDQSKQAESVL